MFFRNETVEAQQIMKGKILIVDDDDDIRDLIASSLKQDYEIAEADSGEEACAKYTEAKPDVVVMDLAIPK